MPVTGSFASLSRLAARLSSLDKTVARMPRELANKSAEMTRLSSNAQRSPEGAAWQKGPATSSPIGRKSGAMLGSIRGTSAGLRWSVRVGRRYAWYFQHGAIQRGERRLSSGPLQKGKRRKLVRGSGRERGFQAARGIVPGARVPSSWVGPLERIIDSRLRADLSL